MTEPQKPETREPDDDRASRPEQHRWRMRYQYRDLIEDLIEDGRQRGLFDDLEGKGRPLDLEGGKFEGSLSLANKLLKDNELRPPWLATRVDVQEKIDALRSAMRETWQRYEAAFRQSAGEGRRGSLTIGWDDACKRWEGEIKSINKLVDGYNLKRPSSSLEMFKLRLDYELERISAPRYLL